MKERVSFLLDPQLYNDTWQTLTKFLLYWMMLISLH
jgi:hypothetical protein